MTASNHDTGQNMPLSTKNNHIHPYWCNDSTICHYCMGFTDNLQDESGVKVVTETKMSKQ
jgi:hypothetical protein